MRQGIVQVARQAQALARHRRVAGLVSHALDASGALGHPLVELGVEGLERLFFSLQMVDHHGQGGADAADFVRPRRRRQAAALAAPAGSRRKAPGSGRAAIARGSEANADASVILTTAFGTVEAALEAIKEGAYDYVSKPVRLDELLLRRGQVLQPVVTEVTGGQPGDELRRGPAHEHLASVGGRHDPCRRA